MSVSKRQKPKKSTVILSFVAVVIIAGLATAVVLLASSKHTTASKQPATSVASSTPADTSQYKLAACTSGATQTLGNSGYVVGTDLAPGKYTVKDAEQTSDSGTGWSNVDIYAKQSDFKGHNDGNETDSVQPFVGDTTNTMLKDGEYVSVWADSAVFTCQ